MLIYKYIVTFGFVFVGMLHLMFFFYIPLHVCTYPKNNCSTYEAALFSVIDLFLHLGYSVNEMKDDYVRSMSSEVGLR